MLPYDKSDPLSIETFAKGLIGMSFSEIIEKKQIVVEDSFTYKSSHSENKKNKGNLGQIVEEDYFGYKCNSDSRADFHEAGVELKVTPYKTNKNLTKSAKERLILTMIDYFKIINESFENSHFWQKSRLILLVYYEYEAKIKFNLDYRIHYVKLFSPPKQDLVIIKKDYELIQNKIKEGKAHELSEGDTLYLGAAPKAANASIRRTQPFSEILAKPRAFAFKTSYMTFILNTYIITGKNTYEPILKDNIVSDFEAHVLSKIETYKGYSIDQLCKTFSVNSEKKPKNLEAILAYRILGIKGNKAEEFEKANIKVKVIRIENNNRIKENMSFPTFHFKELAKETWENSTFGNYLRETRFLFVVFKYDDENILRLRGAQFWNIPYSDLENEVRIVWEKTVNLLNHGLIIFKTSKGYQSNFPKASENQVCHVRPHGRNSSDTCELPDGRIFPKQCFWLNNTYIYNQIKNKLK